MPAHIVLRQATVADHERVDALFGAFDLADADSYARFLTAHASALQAIEPMLLGVAGLPAWRSRSPSIAEDLSALGQPVPAAPAEHVAVPSYAHALGMLYVLEGSRLGGSVLVKRVRAGLPLAYLSATHRAGEWRTLRDVLDAYAARGGPQVLHDLVSGAKAAFDRFAQAAED